MVQEKVRQRRVIVPTWAAEITVVRRRADLWVTCEECGFAALPEDQNLLGLSDSLADFYAAPRRTRETSRQLPHTRFASAADEKRLIEFVRQFGPVLARVEDVDRKGGPVTLVQNLAVLKAEQEVFVITTELVRLLNSLDGARPQYGAPLGSNHSVRDKLRRIGDAVQRLHQAVKRASDASRRRNLPNPVWKATLGFRDSARRLPDLANLSIGHQYVCHILNLFPPILTFAGGSVVECPQSATTGIRPLLYFLLREVYLMKHRIRLCKREGCGKFFIPDRAIAEYCSLACANLVRQRRHAERKRFQVGRS